MVRILFALLGLMAFLCIAGCSRDDVIDQTPNFTIPLLSGGEITEKDLQGKISVVDFWATWCMPCITEIPFYNKLQRKYHGKGLVVLGVVVESGSREDMRQFARGANIDYTVGLGSYNHMEVFGGVYTIPTTFLLDREGRIIKRYIGASDVKARKLEAEIKRLLNGSS